VNAYYNALENSIEVSFKEKVIMTRKYDTDLFFLVFFLALVSGRNPSGNFL